MPRRQRAVAGHKTPGASSTLCCSKVAAVKFRCHIVSDERASVGAVPLVRGALAGGPG